MGLPTDNGWLCYTFDRAVWMFGAWADSKLEEVDSDGKRRWTVEQILNGTVKWGETPPSANNAEGNVNMLLAMANMAGSGVAYKP